MKNILQFLVLALMILILINSGVLAECTTCGQGNMTGEGQAQNQSGQGTGQGEDVQTEQETQNQGQNITILVRERVQLARNASELRQMVQERQQEMNQEMQSLGESQREVYQNQNRVRLAVHSLLAMENLTGGIGRNISQIAQEFNNSVQATIRAEKRIRTRNSIVRFFLGGDQEASEDIDVEVNQNRERIQQLMQLRDQCDCSEEVKNMLQEQIQNMEQEQNRLQQLAEDEKNNRGVFGWLFGLFGR